MNNQPHPDVLVVGAGPGGCAAAKYCAEKGLKTVLAEKKTLPRDKVCTGMIMGRWAFELIQELFGEIPSSILTSPAELRRCGRLDPANHLRRHWQCNKKRYRCCTIDC